MFSRLTQEEKDLAKFIGTFYAIVTVACVGTYAACRAIQKIG